ncbi:CD225/dispanin family protein [Lutibacter sp. HS1-25]|uniref:CD225/dispanin family protein n=1 Tax=Lutibacter sp. HS1-25 TaxID=2485000 RepID=UPI0010116A09|nr:CD225/dispanin family protein [Lutibacter sp. HS1-25]RXP53473.1 CD225/dispanin family protein [Lutibacter sp. HS1-25]
MEQIRPKNYLVESILVTMCCCQPLGIVGIVFASQVNSRYNAGDYNGALQASKDAKKWIYWGFGIGLVFMLLLFAFYAAMFFLGINQGLFNEF